MPMTKKSPVLRMAQFMGEMSPKVKETVMAIINEEEDHLAVESVKYFAGLDVEVARAILDIVVAEVNKRDPNFKRPGRPAKKAPPADLVEGTRGHGTGPPSATSAPAPRPVATAASEANPTRRGRR